MLTITLTRRSERASWPIRNLACPFLLLAFAAVICANPARAKNKSIRIQTGPAHVDLFPQIVRQADKSLRTTAGDVEIRVHFPEGEEEEAARAAEAAAAPVEFLREVTGKSPSGLVTFYVCPLERSAEPPTYAAHGRGLFTEVFLTRKGEHLLDIPSNRHQYLEVYPHELSHSVLDGYRIKDRWLQDGLAEHLKILFRAYALDQGLAPADSNESYQMTPGDWNPAILSLAKIEAGPWSYRDVKTLLRMRQKDPVYAVYFGQQEAWRYSAAAELLSRWMTAARAKGIEAPIQDLLARIQRRRGSIGWREVGELLEEQTGLTFTAITTPSAEELAEARRTAWDQRDAELLGLRLRALRVLGGLGLPENAPPGELLDSFEMPPKIEDAENITWNLHFAAADAVARGGDPKVCRAAYAWLQEAHGDEAFFYGSPALWSCLAVLEPRVAQRLLLDLLLSERMNLEVRDEAQKALEKLTGLVGDWAIEPGPEKRAAAAERWRQRLVGREGTGGLDH